MHYGMVIDAKYCISCHCCAAACKIENNLPEKTWWNRVFTCGGETMESPAGVHPNLTMSFAPVACQHCENPACVKVCPVGATYRDEGTGVVRQDYDKCIGCRMCISACPYSGVRSFNWDEPKNGTDYALGDPDVPEHQKHVVEKCTMCWHRIARGEEPACISVCPSRIRFWGDLDDPESDVAKLIATRDHKTLLPEMGTKPSVYYLV